MSVPAWCTWTRGTSALLLVAPHGGRRPAVDATAPPPHLRVNDVYTPELTALLAARLDAATVINHAQDRNTLDLNRTSQVLRRAPWFLDLLVQQIGSILARCPMAEVLFIHGWNVGQPRCDLGIGAVETSAGLHVPDGAALTIGDEYRREQVEALRAGATAVGIGVSIGERYPASHRNNILQLFGRRTGTADNPAARRLAGWAAEGRVNALQVELGIPLRWPGAWRDRFVNAVAATFGPPAGGPAAGVSFVDRSLLRRGSGQGWSLGGGKFDRPPGRAVPTVTAPHLVARHSSLVTVNPASLQFYDPVADIGMFAGAGPLGPAAGVPSLAACRTLEPVATQRGADPQNRRRPQALGTAKSDRLLGTRATAGRLLLFLGGQRIALFTGENGRGGQVAPLALAVDNGGTRLRFCGPMLRLDDARVYLDLEAALAQSQLVEADVEVSFVPIQAGGNGVQFGRVEGALRIGGERRCISTGAFAHAGGLRASGAAHRQTMLAADFGGGRGLLSRSTDEAGRSVVFYFTSDEMRTLEPTQMALSPDGDIYTPRCFDLRCVGHPRLRAQPRSRLPILRPTGQGGYLRVTFGVAQFEWGTHTGWGLYEHAVPIR